MNKLSTGVIHRQGKPVDDTPNALKLSTTGQQVDKACSITTRWRAAEADSSQAMFAAFGGSMCNWDYASKGLRSKRREL